MWVSCPEGCEVKVGAVGGPQVGRVGEEQWCLRVVSVSPCLALPTGVSLASVAQIHSAATAVSLG